MDMGKRVIIGIFGLIGIISTVFVISQKPPTARAAEPISFPPANPRDYSVQQDMILNFS